MLESSLKRTFFILLSLHYDKKTNFLIIFIFDGT